METKQNRLAEIDFLKGIAIIFVVLFHLGIVNSGYLGVDVFFVIAGFLTASSCCKKIIDNKFGIFDFYRKKILRLFPSILIVCFICFVVGFFFFLPDDFENLVESIIASIGLSNNVLLGITTRNYWDTSNAFKPLMHMWYIGILAEFYVIFPILLVLIWKITKKKALSFIKVTKVVMLILSVASLALFVMPNFSNGDKFYFLPFRFFELSFGTLIYLYKDCIGKIPFVKSKIFSTVSFIIVVLLLAIGIVVLFTNSIDSQSVVIGLEQSTDNLIIPNVWGVILTVLFTCCYLSSLRDDKVRIKRNILSMIGERSYSVFVYHQVVLALYRYIIGTNVSIVFILIYLAVVFGISEINYRLVEQRIKIKNKPLIICVILAVVICVGSGLVYLRAGVVRDVPELGITKEQTHRNMHAEYCDRVRKYDKEFSGNGIKCLVIGNSFARDFGNILLESQYEIDLSYSFDFGENLIDRIKQADVVFVFAAKSGTPSYVFENCDNVYGIGTKNFGYNNGNVYAKRFSIDYYNQTAKMENGYEQLNDTWKQEWGENYIDMIAPVYENGRVKVFTDDNKFISQDCRHLTQSGAIYYTKLLDLAKYLRIE